MDEIAQETLFFTFKAVIDGIIDDKKRNPKNIKRLNRFKAKIILGLHVEEDFIMWVNLIAENGNFELGKGKLDEYDLEIISDPEDLMYFSNGQNSVLNMMLKKKQIWKKEITF